MKAMIVASSTPKKIPSKFGYTVQNGIGEVYNRKDVIRNRKKNLRGAWEFGILDM